MPSPPARRFSAVMCMAAAIVAGGGCPLDPMPTPGAAGTGTGTGPAPCQYNFVGDPSLEPEIEVIALGVDDASSPVEDGGDVALILPPQGGRVVFVGVRAKNVNACAAKLTGVLRDPKSGKIVIDARTVNLKPSEGGAVGSTDSDISTFSNIPVCPNQWSESDAFGSEYELEVTLKDQDGRSVKATRKVTLSCAEPENKAQCLCICKQGYVLGEMCASSGGAPP